MGLLGALGKIIQGKPIYAPDGQPERPPAAKRPAGLVRTEPPRVALERVENEFPNGRYELRVDMKNEAGEALFLDKIILFGMRREIDIELKAGELREISIYSGQPFTQQPKGYAELQYRTVTDGDYFLSRYLPRVRQVQHGFEIDDFRPAGPVKDI